MRGDHSQDVFLAREKGKDLGAWSALQILRRMRSATVGAPGNRQLGLFERLRIWMTV